MTSKLLSCRETHAKEYGSFPAVVASAPGKLGLLGDFTEFAHGLSVNAAILQRVWVAVAPRSDHLVRFFSREYNERKKASVSNIKFRKEDRWANYPKGVLSAFVQRGVGLEGLDLTICGDVPQSAGLSSSQALCLATAAALDALFQTQLAPEELMKIAQGAETGFLGLPTGLTSLSLQTHIQENQLYFYDARTQKGEQRALENDWELALVNSRVPSISFDSSARWAREECESCLRILNSGRGSKFLRDYTKADLRERVGTLPESARRRSLHVLDEIARVSEATELWHSGDWPGIGRLMNRSHESLRDLFEVSCPEIDWLVKRLQEIDGLLGARLTGEDSGACVVALGTPAGWSRFRPISEEYERIFGFKAELTVFRPQEGVRVDQKLEPLG